MIKCKSIKWRAYLLEQLSPSEQKNITVHIKSCSKCSGELLENAFKYSEEINEKYREAAEKEGLEEWLFNKILMKHPIPHSGGDEDRESIEFISMCEDGKDKYIGKIPMVKAAGVSSTLPSAIVITNLGPTFSLISELDPAGAFLSISPINISPVDRSRLKLILHFTDGRPDTVVYGRDTPNGPLFVTEDRDFFLRIKSIELIKRGTENGEG